VVAGKAGANLRMLTVAGDPPVTTAGDGDPGRPNSSAAGCRLPVHRTWLTGIVVVSQAKQRVTSNGLALL